MKLIILILILIAPISFAADQFDLEKNIPTLPVVQNPLDIKAFVKQQADAFQEEDNNFDVITANIFEKLKLFLKALENHAKLSNPNLMPVTPNQDQNNQDNQNNNLNINNNNNNNALPIVIGGNNNQNQNNNQSYTV